MAILPNRSDRDDSGVWPRIDSVAAAGLEIPDGRDHLAERGFAWPIVVAPCSIVDEKLPEVEPAASSVVAVLSIVTEIVSSRLVSRLDSVSRRDPTVTVIPSRITVRTIPTIP